MKPLLGHFPEDIPRAYNGILAIRSCFALKAQSIAEIESDNRSARVLQQEITQRANGDSVSDARALGLGRPSMPRIDFRSRRRFQLIQQIIGLHAQPLAPAHLHVGLAHLFLGKCVPHLGGAARRKRHHVVRKMHGARGLLLKSQSAQPCDDDFL